MLMKMSLSNRCNKNMKGFFWGIVMFNIGDTLQSKACPTMAGTIIKLDKNRAVIRITRTRYSKDIGRELVIDTSFWKKI